MPLGFLSKDFYLSLKLMAIWNFIMLLTQPLERQRISTGPLLLLSIDNCRKSLLMECSGYIAELF